MTCSLTDTQVDGLHTNVFLPETAPRSVLIIRTPYDAAAHRAEAHAWARRGIAVVTQDVRGRHRSRGRFRPFENEGADGLATLQWVASRSWAGAPVILYGTSYSAHCAVETAIAAAEAGVDVGGVSVAVPALGLGETARNIDGCFYLQSRVGWWLEHGEGPESPGAAIPDDLLDTLPVADIGRRATPPISAWERVIRAERRDRERGAEVSRLRCPLLAVGGMADWFAQDTADLWTSWGGPAALVMGPWDHSLRGSDRARRMESWIDDVCAGTPTTGAQVLGLPGGTVDLARWPSTEESTVLPGGRFPADPTDPFPSMAHGADVSEAAARPDCLVLDLPSRSAALIGTPTVRVHSTHGAGHWGALLATRRRDGRLEQTAHGMSTHTTIHLTPVAAHLDTGESMVLILSAHSFPRHARDLQARSDHLAGTETRAVLREVESVTLDMPA